MSTKLIAALAGVAAFVTLPAWAGDSLTKSDVDSVKSSISTLNQINAPGSSPSTVASPTPSPTPTKK